jgi:hypothetical protein
LSRNSTSDDESDLENWRKFWHMPKAASRRQARGGPTEVLPLYKKFLKVEEHRLRLRHQAGGGGREICTGRAELVDVLLRYVFGAASSSAARGNGEAEVPLALIALGGYGRGELNPFSDVDVMLLHEQRAEVSPHLKEMVNQILYLLWDSGFKVGTLYAFDQRSHRAGQQRHAHKDCHAGGAISRRQHGAGDRISGTISF